MMIREELKYDRARAWSNGDFICIETRSYFASYATSLDPHGKQHFHPPDSDESALGQAVLDSLAYSRIVLFGEETEVYTSDKDVEVKYSAWMDGFFARYGYRAKRVLFKKMALCTIERRGKDNSLAIIPSRHDMLESWRDLHDRAVILPADSRPEEIGAALRVAFSRCIV